MTTPSPSRIAYRHLQADEDAEVIPSEVLTATVATYPVEGPYGIDYPDGSAIRHSGLTPPPEPLWPDKRGVAQRWLTREASVACDGREVATLYLHLSNGGATYKVVDAGNGPEFVASLDSFSEMSSEVRIKTLPENLRRIGEMLLWAAQYDRFSHHWGEDSEGLHPTDLDRDMPTYWKDDLFASFAESKAWWELRDAREKGGYDPKNTMEDALEDASDEPSAFKVAAKALSLRPDYGDDDEEKASAVPRGKDAAVDPVGDGVLTPFYHQPRAAVPRGDELEKTAFNKYDPSELLAALVEILEKYELKDMVKDVKKLTPNIQRAWRTRER